jgi:hypothetical protein
MTSDPVGVTIDAHSRDYNGDRLEDLLAVRESDGALLFYAGNGDGTFDAPVSKASGWGAMDVVMAGDLTADGKADVLARDTRTGTLYTYPGNGSGGLGTRITVGTGWNGMREITAVGDLDHDGHADVMAIRSSDNCMYIYGGRGDGTLKAGVQTSCNWVGYDMVAAVGDFNGDGHADWIARRASDGAVYLYKGNGAGGYSARSQVVTGWTWANAIA